MNDNASPNYGYLRRDADDESPYITEVGTLRKVYQHPPCEICGIRNWTYRPVLDIECGACKLGRVARNEANG